MTAWTGAVGPDRAGIAPALPGRPADAPGHLSAHDAGVTEDVRERRLDDVVRAHLPGLLRYAAILTGDEHTGADVVQDVLLRAHQRWARIALMERPDLYLRRMVTNEHLSWRRRWHVRTIRPSSDEVVAAHAGKHEDHAHGLTEHDAMWQRLADLPPRQRAVLVLRYYEGLTDVETARVLGTSSTTVRSHASRALATLRQTTTTPPTETR